MYSTFFFVSLFVRLDYAGSTSVRFFSSYFFLLLLPLLWMLLPRQYWCLFQASICTVLVFCDSDLFLKPGGMEG